MLNVAFVASEVAPFAKTGGLADVAGSLPKALHQIGCDVKVLMPKYNTIDESRFPLHYVHSIGEMPVRVAGSDHAVHVLTARLPGSEVDVYLFDCPRYFHRGKIYTADPDEDERFILLTKASIETFQRLAWAPDIIHCNDWQTALLPLLLKDNYSWDHFFRGTATFLSIHNIGYQGVFGPATVGKAEINPSLFVPGGPVELNGAVCFLKAGILYAEGVGTVSETYAREILTSRFGAGLETVLRARASDVHGVLNGIDTNEWNPESDTLLPFHYSLHDMSGKEENKKFLLKQTTIPYRPGVPVIGIVSRLVAQKGFDLVAEAINDLMAMDAQWVILGSGQDRYEQLFQSLGHSLPDRVWAYIGFNNELAHLIEAGADMFLMPSHYEPCGLNQMYSLRYGTVPIVRKTGGLADTVFDWHESAHAGQTRGNGFSFHDPTGYALSTSVLRALQIYQNDKDTWRTIQRNGMSGDFSWATSAAKYLDLYRLAVSKRASSLPGNA